MFHEEFFDFKNVIAKDVFSEKEIEDIYNHIEATKNNVGVMELFGQLTWHSWVPDNIVSVIEKRACEETGLDLELREVQFARYTVDSGTHPKLTPHTDEAFAEPRVTFDIQVKSNTSWPIVVEGREYSLSDNQAVLFSGTHQVHWRTKKEFTEDDYIDMIFAHLSPKGIEKNILDNEEFKKIMVDKRTVWEKEYNLND
jgi:hypothetical protein